MIKKWVIAFPKNVVILSFVSLLNDVAGETVRRLFPLFLSNILGVKTTIIGLIEGVGEATPHLFEPISGYLSDRSDRRKIFVVIGQILRSSMVLLVFVVSWPQALLVRFLDRSGKGLALGPRDALIAKSVSHKQEGSSFGLNRAMDNLGALIGTLLIILIILVLGNPVFLERHFFQILIILVVAPSLLLALLLIIFGVSDKKDGREFVFKDHLGKGFYTFLLVSFVFSLGSFSDGFLVLKAQEAGISLIGIFVLLAFLTLTSAAIALPAGSYSDHHERRRVMGFSWLLFSACYVGFGNAQSFWQLLLLFVIYGVYYGVTQGVARAIITDFVPHTRLGLAYGLYNMVVGLALFPASLAAGYLWQRYTSSVAFYFGASLTLIAAFLMFYVLPHPNKHFWEVWKE